MVMVENQESDEDYFKSYVDLVKEDTIPWEKFVSLMDTLTPTLVRAKSLIKILLKEFKSFKDKEKLTKRKNLDGASKQYGLAGKKYQVEDSNSENQHDYIDLVNLDVKVERDILYDSTSIQNTHQDQAKHHQSKNNFLQSDFQASDDNAKTVIEPSTDSEFPNEGISENKFKKIKCLNCDKAFSNIAALNLHNKTKHKNECYICQKNFSKAEYKKHTLLHHVLPNHKESILCDVCDKPFSRPHSVIRHFQKTHEKVKHTKQINNLSQQKYSSFQCNTCEKTFSSKSSLERHKISVHEKENRYQCKICVGKDTDISFARKDTLERHMKNVHQREDNRNFECQQCKQSFVTEIGLTYHRKQSHVESVKYQCDICGDAFSTKGELSIHDIMHE